MAIKKTASAAKGSKKVASGADFDELAWLQDQGVQVTEDDIQELGTLTPIYSGEVAIEEEWPPLYGKLITEQMLPIRDGNKIVERPFYVLECLVATKALAGTKETGRETVDVEKGQLVLMPKSGSIKNVKELSHAAMDPTHIYNVLFRYTGELIDTGKQSPMKKISAKFVGAPEPRSRKYQIAPVEVEVVSSLPVGTTQSGHQFDRNGVVKNRLVERTT